MGILDRISGREAEQLKRELQDLRQRNRHLEGLLKAHGVDLPPKSDDVDAPPSGSNDVARLAEERDILSRLSGIVAELAQKTDLEALLEFIVKTFIDVTGAARGFLLLQPEADQKLDLHLAIDKNGDRIKTVERVSRSIAREVARTGKPKKAGSAWREEGLATIDSIRQGQMQSVLCLPLRDRDRKPIGAVYVDDPDRRDAFRDKDTKLLESFCDLASIVVGNLQEQQKRLRMERLAAVGLTANYLLHDVKTPLTIIRGCAEILSDEAKDKELAESIIAQVGRLTDMARDVYDFSRGDRAVDRVEVEADGILGEIRAVFENVAGERGISLVVGKLPGARLAVHRGKVVRALSNLIQNAIEALPKGGSVNVQARQDEAGGVAFDVQDDGPGLPETVRDRLFEAFHTAGKEGGRGLGMAIVRDIVESHGGIIKVAPGKDGKGTRFIVGFPPAGPSSAGDSGPRFA